MHVGKKKEKACCGCTACEAVCPVQAIVMQADELGFYYPAVDEDKCFDCGKCFDRCQFHQDYNRYNNYPVPSIYGCRLKDNDELLRSQSGGASHAIVKKLIELGYVVYGAGFVSPHHVKHIRVDNEKSAQALRGSKYVQSDLIGVFKAVIKDLEDGHKVLFLGTSCQVAGLKSVVPEYLFEGLFAVDLVCHGTPSPKIWEDHVHYQERKLKRKVVSANFRDKSFGWHSRREVLKLDNDEMISVRTFNIITDLAVRPSCSQCPFTNYKRVGDLSIGDFWGWERHYVQWSDNKGVSLVMINSKRGQEVFSQLDTLDFIMSTCDKCYQPQLEYPLRLSESYRDFQSDYINHGYLYAMRKYSDLSISYKVKQKCYRIKALILKLIS